MYGCEGSILQLLKLPDGTVKVLVEGIKRVKIVDFKDDEKFINNLDIEKWKIDSYNLLSLDIKWVKKSSIIII